MHRFYDGNSRKCKILFADNAKKNIYSSCIDCSIKKIWGIYSKFKLYMKQY